MKTLEGTYTIGQGQTISSPSF